MPVNWEQFSTDLDSIIASGVKRTDEQLASRISAVTRMTEEEVRQLFPEPADAKKLADLTKIVKDATDRNTKITNIAQNAQQFAGVILTLLQKFM